MQSIAYIPGSDGVTNASMATLQNTRSAGATTNIVNTVSGFPAKFYATMGTPHTFTDPQTGETITVISEATARDFAGHLDSGKIEIDAISPGQVDIGSQVGDIIVVRPNTEWANNIKNILSQSHNDSGTIKNDSISDRDMFTDNLDPVTRYTEALWDYVASGCAWTGDAYASTRAASMTAGVVYIGGKRFVVNAVTARLFTASKDTYIDAPIPASGNTIVNADIVYTEVANNAASPALAANSIRLGIIVTGASNIASVASINQGEIGKILPIASSIPYTVADSLGNLICNRNSNPGILLQRKQSAAQAGITTIVDMTGQSGNIILAQPAKIKITLMNTLVSTVAADRGGLHIYVNGSLLRETYVKLPGTDSTMAAVIGTVSLAAGTHAIKGRASRIAGTGTITVDTSGDMTVERG